MACALGHAVGRLAVAGLRIDAALAGDQQIGMFEITVKADRVEQQRDTGFGLCTRHAH